MIPAEKPRQPDDGTEPDAEARPAARPGAPGPSGTHPASSGTASPARPVLLRAAVVAAVPMLVLTAAWIVAGRALFGAGGLLVPVFLVTLGPLYALVMGVGVHRMVRAARRTLGRSTTAAVAGVQAVAWVLALAFGFLVPDRVHGHSTSALAQVLGEQVLGLSAGFGNTLGILAFVAAVWFMVLAWGEDRRTRQLAQGRPVTEDELLDAQGYEGTSAYQPPNYWT